MANLWSSPRLIYRAVEDDDDPFILSIKQNPEAYLNQMPFLPVPPGTKSAKKTREWYETQLLSAIVCLPPPSPDSTKPSSEPPSKPTPIGFIFLFASDPRETHHRRSEVGLGIAKPYQGQGYGSEAITWVLDFGFRRAGLHRIGISAFAWNTGAVRLYERLGFVVESRQREMYWHDGRFWDCVGLAMLEGEWRERYGGVGGGVVEESGK